MSKRRLGYIDQFRGLAVIFMIETHVVNGLLMDALRGQATFRMLDFFNGLVAPSFLFIAGFSFTLAIMAKGDAYRNWSPELRRHLRRLGYIGLIGYALHLPFLSLRKTFYGSSDEQFARFVAVDILQCIAVTLLIVHLLRLCIKDERKFRWILYVLFLGFVFLTPFLDRINLAGYLPLLIAQYFNRAHDSGFPLFPWSAFLMGGIILSQWLYAREKPLTNKTLIGIGLVSLLLGMALAFMGTGLWPGLDDWYAWLRWFMIRFGILLLMFCAVKAYEERRAHEHSAVKIFGRESLLVYVAHLVIVYGSILPLPFLTHSFGRSFDYGRCLIWFSLVAASMFALAYLWSYVKRNRYTLARRIQYSFSYTFLFLFIINPY